jgi:4-hydroxy-tetrahydrodipicolinate reductase
MERDHHLRVQSARTRRLPVVVVGLGPIGLEVAQLLLVRPKLFRLVAAVDRAPELAGRPLREVLGDAAPRGRIRLTPPAAPRGQALAFLTTTSSVRSVAATIRELLDFGYHIVSSTEELSYPSLRAPRLAAVLDRAARKAGRCVVGTGINPGFAMDVWPLVLASNMQTLERVQVTRVVDAAKRRRPLQLKVGAGMSRREFEALAQAGRIGHVGLVESCAHLAAALGWELERVHESLRPKVATRRIRTEHVDVQAGRVCGIVHRAVGYSGQRALVELDLQMYLGAKDARDDVLLEGTPPLRCTVPGGFHGDRTTASQLLSAAARVDGFQPGLHIASDLPTPRRPGPRLKLSLIDGNRGQ